MPSAQIATLIRQMNPKDKELQLLHILARGAFLATSLARLVSSATYAATSYPVGESDNMQNAQPVLVAHQGEDVLRRLDVRDQLDRNQDRRDE